MAVCPTCRRDASAGCACGRGGAVAPNVISVPPIFRLPQSERTEGVVRSVRVVAAASSDRPVWARALDALALLPVFAFLISGAAIAVTVRLVAGMLGGGRRGFGGLGLFGRSARITQRLREISPRLESVTALEIDAADGAVAVRVPVAPSRVHVQPGDHVTVTSRGRSQGAARAVCFESPAAGRVAAPLVTARAVAGAFFALFVVVLIAGA